MVLAAFNRCCTCPYRAAGGGLWGLASAPGRVSMARPKWWGVRKPSLKVHSAVVDTTTEQMS